MREPRSAVPRAAALLAAPLLALCAAAGAAAQEEVNEVAAACTGGITLPAEQAYCREVALAYQGVQAAVGLAASGGSDLPGSASTLGRRFGTVPRVAIALQGGLTRAELPQRATTPPADGGNVFIPSVQGSVTVGLFDGLSILPTVGGILSLDVWAAGDVLLLRSNDGFGEAVRGLGAGVRVGLLRESFTLPGISVSAGRRWIGDVTWTDPQGNRAARIETDPTVTSLRALVGKDLLTLGLTAGAGWDRYEGDGTLVIPPLVGLGVRSAEVEDFQADRLLFFGGASLNFLVIQLAGEVGWARGFDDIPGRAEGGYDPSAGSLFGNVALRLTL